jgi:hypothetical protein
MATVISSHESQNLLTADDSQPTGILNIWKHSEQRKRLFLMTRVCFLFSTKLIVFNSLHKVILKKIRQQQKLASSFVTTARSHQKRGSSYVVLSANKWQRTADKEWSSSPES